MSNLHDAPADAQAQKLVQEARAAIDAYRQLIAAAGVTPESCLEALRSASGEAAVQRVRREVDDALREVTRRIERESLHSPPRRPARGIALRGGGV
jgi:DNA-binding protein H-NS